MKRETRDKLMEVRKLRREQLKLIESIANPLRDNMVVLDRTLNNELNVEQYLESSKRLDKWFNGLIRWSGERKEIDGFLTIVEENNPYPKDVFKKKTAADWKKFHTALADKGLVGDGFMGVFGRTVWQNCIDELRKESGLDGETNDR